MACRAPRVWSGPELVRRVLRARGLPPGLVDAISCDYHHAYPALLHATYQWAGTAYMTVHFPRGDLHAWKPEDFPPCR